MESVCKPQEGNCDLALMEMNRKISRITDFERNIQIYEPTRNRQKRNPLIAATALITSLAFGTIEWIRMSKYEKILDNLKTGYNTLHKFDLDQTIFMKEKMFEGVENVTNELTVNLEKNMDEIYREMTWAERHRIISHHRGIFELWYEEHEQLSEMIVDHLENIKHGQMTHLIPADFFLTNNDRKHVTKQPKATNRREK